ncbi:MAG: hypothetical protein ABIS50_15305 [Luteolibacter sp.]|uniref:hypothetical protein n=1 Tax=Luteolibacter sp. TaxID=1962973 RepID=UPI00326318AA
MDLATFRAATAALPDDFKIYVSMPEGGVCQVVAPIEPLADGVMVFAAEIVRSCRVCGCTDEDCTDCIERTGQPCHWVGDDLCSACENTPAASSLKTEN